jgi:hypothetical protein
MGLLAEKVVRRVSLVLNFEDLTVTRQTRFAPMISPTFSTGIGPNSLFGIIRNLKSCGATYTNFI